MGVFGSARWRSAVGCVTGRCAPAAPALAVLAVFAAVGAAVLDDYGVSGDEPLDRSRAVVAADYVFGDGVLLTGRERYYGVSFEALLLLAERLSGLTDSRAVFLLRRPLTHLFFLTAGCSAGCWRSGCAATAGWPCSPCCCTCSIPGCTPTRSSTARTSRSWPCS